MDAEDGMTFQIMEEMTDGFSEERKLGQGAFGVVYKGMTRNGDLVAVKRLCSYRLDFEQLRNEFYNLRKLNHKNIVQVLGYCFRIEKKPLIMHDGSKVFVKYGALCLEYMHNGSLQQHLSDEFSGLKWRTRFKIIKGTCEGLKYINEELKEPIYHLDLKPDNILLDKDMFPKIADFGFLGIFRKEQTRITQNPCGTQGYQPPEYIDGGEISGKFDIFSLGVVIIRIVAGPKGYHKCLKMSSDEFIDQVQKNWRNRLQGTYSDGSLVEAYCYQVKICIQIALFCVVEDRQIRPNIGKITEKLNEIGKITEKLNEIVTTTGETMELNILERIVAGSDEPSHIDFPFLQRVTENFSEKRRIGVGGCGEVYKVVLRNGVVAVKRLFKSRTIKDKTFHRELKSLITVRHQNIVCFLGYCSFTEERAIPFEGGIILADIRERLLCFEYISNGCLESHLTDELRGLEWHTRYEIILGICKGLLYLHMEKDIIHMDLKPANILLDDNMVPKITDFGLSRLDNSSQTTTASRLISPGYCAPEYHLQGKSSSKSDIYSLGVIIMEVVTGSNKVMPNIGKVLRRWRYRWMKSSKHTPLAYQQVTKCLELAQRCTQLDPTCRPDISDIIYELNEVDTNDAQFHVIPCSENMLGIEPLEIHFPFEELGQQISPTIELKNDTDGYFAFITKTSLRRLRTEPEKGIVPPRSKCSVTVTMMQMQVPALMPNNRYKEIVTVVSTRVDGGLAVMDIAEDMFIELDGEVVDEVNVMVVLGKPPLEKES